MAAITVGELAVALVAETRDYQRKLDAADRKTAGFARSADRSTRNVARSFGRMAASLGVVAVAAAAVGVALTAAVSVKIAANGIRLAGAYETLGVRLKILTGSAQGAKEVLDEVDRLVVRTPFGLQELGNAASSVGVIFKSNIDKVAEFTGVAADLAAAFGRPVEQIGENLTRAFSSGLGAADVFREAGITQLILEQAGATDVAKVSAEQLETALRELTSEGGLLFGAAAAAAATLEGSLSNNVIAAENFQRAIGQALSPSVVSAGINVIQPFFEDLKATVEANSEEIDAFAREVIPALGAGFAGLIGVAASVVRGFGTLQGVFARARVPLAALQLGIVTVVEGLNIFRQTVASVATVVINGFRLMGRAARGDFAGVLEISEQNRQVVKDLEQQVIQSTANVEAAAGVVGDLALESLSAGAASRKFAAGLDAVAAKAKVAAAELRDLQNVDAPPGVDVGGGGTGGAAAGAGGPGKQQVAALSKIQAVTQALTVDRLRAVEPLQAEIFLLQQEIAGVQALQVSAEDQATKAAALVALKAEQVRITEELLSLDAQAAAAQAKGEAALSKLAEVDPKLAAELGAAFNEELAGATGVASRAEIAKSFAEQVSEELEEQDIGTTLGAQMADAFAGAAGDLFSGGGAGAGFDLGTSLAGPLGDQFGKSFGEAFDDKKLGATAGRAATSAISAGLAIAQGALKKPETSTRSLQASAGENFESVEKVRGIQAGATNVGIGQVDRAIGKAIEPLTLVARRQLAVLEAIEANTAGGGLGSAGSPGLDGDLTDFTEALA